MEDWKEYNIADASLIPLTDLVEFIVDNRGKTVPTASTGIKLIATNCIRNEYLYPLYEKVRFVSEDIYNTWFRSHPKPGDIIFVNKGTPGKCALVPDPVDFCIAQDMMAFRLKSDIVYNKYLLAILRSREIQSFIMNNQVGTIIPHFKKEQLKTLMIPLPKMQIQKRIGDFYFNISEKAEINRRINENLEQQAQALFKSWFVDFEPFKDQPFVESELGMIPQGWRVEKLGTLCNCLLGGTPSRNNPDYWNGDIAWINSGEVNMFRITKPSEYITEEGLKRSATKLLPKKTTVLAITGATLGQVSLLEIDSCANQSVIGVLENKSYPYSFIYPLIKERIEELMSHMTGGAQQHINKNNVEGLDVIVPPQNIMEQYNKIAMPLYELIGKCCIENDRLAELRDTLLPKLMSGELNVENVNF